MRFRFIGKYTNGHTGINACGVDFVGREPAEVTDPDGVRRLSGNPEFEVVAAKAEKAEMGPVIVSPTVSAPPPKRGRPRKARSAQK